VNNQDRNSYVAPSTRLVQCGLVGGLISFVVMVVGAVRMFTEKGGW